MWMPHSNSNNDSEVDQPVSDLLLMDEEILTVSRQKELCPIVDTMGIKICQAVAKAQLAKCQDHYYERIAHLQDMVESAKSDERIRIIDWLGYEKHRAPLTVEWIIANLEQGKGVK